MSVRRTSTFRQEAKTGALSRQPRKGGIGKRPLNRLVVTKNGEAGTRVIELKTVRERLKRLYQARNEQIRDLQGEVKEDFSQLTRDVNILYDTQFYPVIHNLIQETFQDVRGVKPGTIAAYAVGCLLPTNVRGGKALDTGCSVICASSAPPPEGTPGFKFCANTVMLAAWDPQQREFRFTEMNSVNDKTNAYIYVPFSRLEDFPGFSEAEKRDLATYEGGKIRNINLMYHSPDGKTYHELLNGFVPIADLPARNGMQRRVPQGNPQAPASSNKMSPGMIALIILGILLLLALAWYAFSRPKKMPTGPAVVKVEAIRPAPIIPGIPVV